MNRKRSVLGAVLLLAYLLCVGLLTGPSLYQLFAGRLPVPRVELIPFADIFSVLTDAESPSAGVFANLAGNVLMFLPLGFLLPLFWRYFQTAKHTVLCGLTLSVSIELIQLIAGGVTSVDDVLLNTLGAAIGFGLSRLLFRSPRASDSRAAWAYPLGCWLAVIAVSTASDFILLG